MAFAIVFWRWRKKNPRRDGNHQKQAMRNVQDKCSKASDEGKPFGMEDDELEMKRSRYLEGTLLPLRVRWLAWRLLKGASEESIVRMRKERLVAADAPFVLLPDSRYEIVAFIFANNFIYVISGIQYYGITLYFYYYFTCNIQVRSFARLLYFLIRERTGCCATTSTERRRAGRCSSSTGS
jgi:hypothetical protein